MTETPAPDLRVLRELAEAATPGDWLALTYYANRGEVILREDDPDEDAPPCVIAGTDTKADAAFIAAANPTAVLALLDRLEAAEAAVERVQALADELADPDAELITPIERAHRRTVARELRSALDAD